MNNYQTKYPIVLVHGMMLKDFKRYRAFRGISNELSANGVKVYVTNQDGVGTIENNAKQLKDMIKVILEEKGIDKVNVIAHSKGGLDIRYMIHHFNMGKQIASLTTLSTPHHGSKLSSTILKIPRPLAKFIAFFINLFYRLFGDKNPDIIALGYDLSAEKMITFNENILDSKEVYYQSYSADLDDKKCFIMKLPHKITKYTEHDKTDGIVSVSSSMWGDYRGSIENNYDHIKMVGGYGGKKALKEISKFYLEIVKDLKEKGF